MSARPLEAQPITDAELAEVRRRLANPETILSPLVRSLVARIDALQSTLDRISYKCADYDAELSQAESMTGEKCLFERGQERAAREIDRIIAASGYVVKPRPEDDDA